MPRRIRSTKRSLFRRGMLAAIFVSLMLNPGNADDQSMPENFRRENLVAWCVVPFDAKQRGPDERAKMLADLGLKRCAYDWRERHVAEFEDEVDAYDRNGIEYVSFWGQHPKAYEMFESRGMKPDIWMMFGSPETGNQSERVEQAVAGLLPLVKKTRSMGCRLGLYNHGGWSGEPENLVSICASFHARGFDHVGIVYNFHHSHHRIKEFKDDIDLMMPHLHCINLNGMLDLSAFSSSQDKKQHKIRPIGGGDFEAEMIDDIIASGYNGPIGILGHVNDRDVAEVLQENLEGLSNLLHQRKQLER
ncbi:MAG: hypothetical protein AAF802_06690 [Planctomycetota bacterium]